MCRGKKIVFLLILGVSICASPSFSSTNNFSSIVSSYLRGILYLEEGNYKEARREFEQTKKEDPDSGYLRLRLAFVLLRLGEEKLAEKELKEAKNLEPQSLESSVALIFLYANQGRDKELEEEYQYFLEKAHQLKPTDRRISEYLGQFYFYKRKPEAAIEIYKAIVEQNPQYPDGYFWLGYFYEETGRRREAIKMWEKAIELNPNHSDALNSLGYIYAEEGIKLDEAEKMVKKALDNDPENGAYLDSLGWIYFKKKNYKKAEIFLLKAEEHLKEPVIYQHLGDLYEAMENSDKALQYYKRGLQLKPDDLQLKERVKRYESKSKRIKKEGK